MSAPAYPYDDLDSPELVRDTMGTFWSSVFQDAPIVLTLCQGASLVYKQTMTNFSEAADCLARETVPVFHRQHWQQIVLRQSEMNGAVSSVRYGDGALYGAAGAPPYDHIISYGGSVSGATYAFPVDSSLVKVLGLTNRVSGASVLLQPGVDFVLDTDRAALVFVEDPFESDQFATRAVYNEQGEIVDKELSMWAFETDTDNETVWKQVGHVLRAYSPSSTWYRDMLNALWDAHAGGTTEAALRRAVASAIGVPLVQNDDEVVEAVISSPVTQVVTDKAVYTLSGTAEASVAVGDVLHKYDSVADTLAFLHLSGHAPADSQLPGITLGRSFLGGTFFSSLTFMNEDVPLVYLGPDDDGIVKVTFEVRGFESDVEMFWELVHQRGKAAGQTLANLLDTREDPVGEPTEYDLPATVNPLQLVLRNLFGPHTFAVKVKTGGINPDAPGIGALRKLRSAVPPRMLCLIFIEVQAGEEAGTVTEDVEVATGHGVSGSEVLAAAVEGTPFVTELLGRVL